MIAKGQLDTPIATTELQFEVGNVTFVGRFKVISNLANPIIGHLLLQRNGTVLDMRRPGILNFPIFSLELKDENNSYPNITEPLLSPLEIFTPTWKTNNNLG